MSDSLKGFKFETLREQVSVFESFLRVQKLKVLCVCLGDPWEVHLKTQGKSVF